MKDLVRSFPEGHNQAFRKKYVNIFADNYPSLLKKIISGKGFGQEESVQLAGIMNQSKDMRIAVALHLAKFAPPQTQAKNFGRKTIETFIENWYQSDKHVSKDIIMDGIIDFMMGNKEEVEHFSKVIRSWEATQSAIARAMNGVDNDHMNNDRKDTNNNANNKDRDNRPDNGPS